MHKKVCVIGGGISGMCAAHELSKRGFQVELIEEGDELGGLLSSYKIGNYRIEKAYHHVFKGDDTFTALLRELGLEKKLTWSKATLGFLYDRVYPMNSPMDFAAFGPLSLDEKMKVALLTLRMRLTGDYEPLDSKNLEDWLVENAGGRVYEKFYKPMLEGKFGNLLGKISAAWFFARIRDRTKSRSLSGEYLGYLEGGFQTFVSGLEKELKRRGVAIRLNLEAVRIAPSGTGISVTCRKGGRTFERTFDAAISTIPLPLFSGIAEVPEPYRKELAEVEYQDSICALFGISESISPVYWLNIGPPCSFKALIEHTKFRPKGYGKEKLAYLTTYQTERFEGMSDKAVLETLSRDLLRMFPKFRQKSIKWRRLYRIKYSCPLYKKGYLRKMPDYSTPVRNLYVTGMFRNYPERAIEPSVVQGIRCAERLISDFDGAGKRQENRRGRDKKAPQA